MSERFYKKQKVPLKKSKKLQKNTEYKIMEIINFVQGSQKSRKNNFISKFNMSVLNFQKKEKTQAITYQSYIPKIRTFVPQKVKKSASAKNFFKILGGFLTDFSQFISKNTKSVLIFGAILFFSVAVTFFSFIFIQRKINFTNPLKLQLEDSLDIENLNKLMANFALEGTLNVDEQGNILDANSSKLQLFTEPVTFQNYTVRSGDTISGIAKKFGLRNISTLISVNDIGNVRQLAAGQKLKIPSVDGIIYTVKTGDSLNSVVSKYGITLENLIDVNELSSEVLQKGQQLFLPGVGLDSSTLRNAMGDMFKLPISAKFRWTSPYGSRIDPIANVKSFHTGVDMACPTGTPILASMSGRVTTTGVNRVYGNYVIIDHGNGYQTLYAHMSKIIAIKGQWVSQGTRIGLVGSTGYSTGPHLHFTVYKNGKLINPMSVLK